ncbi:MAG: DNA topoisomerase IV subunit A [Geminicoccaceae bacterium]
MLHEALSERYLAYALSTITARSLPDVRDGLKPVQRRLLYAMLQLRLDPAGGFKKCARVVGDVMGKFHPHGDSAIYDAMVRLAQEFAQRYTLVDGQGNFGNIDGDNPAAMRYTEARLTEIAKALLDGIDQDTVDFKPTYDGNEDEPAVLPAGFPNLLANGAAGIAVGMATSIPPHNVGELCDALRLMLARAREAGQGDSATVPIAELVQHVKGPDFPTGGLLVDSPEVLEEAYATGRGSVRLRARWQREDLAMGQFNIVVTEIPYQVQKSRLIERLADLLAQKKLPLLADFQDESAEDVRIVFTPRARTVDPHLLMEQLFRASELENRFSFNMNVIDARGVPRVMNLRELLQAFLDHRMVVLERRSRYRLGKIDDRLEVVGGYLIAFLNLDEVIRIIREEDDPKLELMRAFDLTERQATAILDMRLRNLRKLEEMELKKEQKALRKERQELLALLDSRDLRLAALEEEIASIKERFADPRRTGFAEAPEIDTEALSAPAERFPVTVVCSAKGWIRALRGQIDDAAELKFKEGDGPRFLLPASSADKLLITTTTGKVFLLPIDRLPGGRGMGEPLSVHLDISDTDLLELHVHDPAGKLLLATAHGRGFVAEETAIAAQTRAGRQVVNLDASDRLAAVRKVEGDAVAIMGENRKLLVFALDDLPVMSRGKGVLLQRYKTGGMADICVLKLEDGLAWQQGGRVRREPDLSAWLGKRASAGRNAPNGFPRDNRFAPPNDEQG